MNKYISFLSFFRVVSRARFKQILCDIQATFTLISAGYTICLLPMRVAVTCVSHIYWLSQFGSIADSINYEVLKTRAYGMFGERTRCRWYQHIGANNEGRVPPNELVCKLNFPSFSRFMMHVYLCRHETAANSFI